MKNIKVNLGFSLFLLTGIGMLVTNFVTVPFWANDILVRETRHLQQRLSALANLSGSEAERALQLVLADLPAGCVSWNGVSYSGSQTEAACLQGLQSIVAAAKETGIVQTSDSGLPASSLFASRYFYVVVPLTKTGGTNEIAAAGIPLAQILQPLWNKEKIIAVYLLFNALVLATLAFFRLLKSYVQPVDRLVQAAESYRGDGLHPFCGEKSANELGRLAGSIQAMVQRIETDKEILAKTVQELAEKNKQLHANQREMVRAEKLASVGRLSAGLAHEIGNPLGVVQGYLQLLGMGDCRVDESTEYVARALKELGRVDDLIRQLLDYARKSKGEPERFDVHHLLVDFAETLRVQPLWDGIRLDLALEAEHSTVFADREQLRQVLLNCLLNAADAIKACKDREKGAISLTTALAAPAFSGNDTSMLQIAIEDNGEGVSSELLDTVFDPFFTTKEPGAGTGLGLSVSLALIESMGGTIRLESIAGTGTTVLLQLPLVAEAAAGADVFSRENGAVQVV